MNIELNVLRSLFEAARWAPSSFNEQPWRFVVAPRQNSEHFGALLSCLVKPNQTWCKDAACLVITAARTTFACNNKPNRHAFHDVGLAVAQLSVQATSMGIGVHQLAGFDVFQAREVCSIPQEFDPVTALALGYPGNASGLPDNLRERESAPRVRKPQGELVFGSTWGTSL